MKRIAVFGLGYVGLSAAVCFASKGFKIIGVDADPEKIKIINEKKNPIREPGLDNLLKRTFESRMLCCTEDCEYAICNSDISFLTVGTPVQRNGHVDLKYMRSVAEDVGEALRTKREYHLVVVKSTVLPGTTENVIKPLIERSANKKCGDSFDICYNPEFMREGTAVKDILNPDRIIIGEFTPKSGDILERFYRVFYGRNPPPVIRTKPVIAELVKYANNAFLATKISFINTIAGICEKLADADVTVVAKAIGLDGRISSAFLDAGLGYGGSCLPKDIKAFASFSEELGINPKILRAVKEVNDLQPYRVVELAKSLLGHIEKKRVAILGLAFKPDTDDMREAVSIKVINRLLDKGAEVIAYDPMAMEKSKVLFEGKIKYASSAVECIDGADCCIIVTEWPEFKTLRWEDFINHMKRPILIDGRRIYDAEEFDRRLKYAAIGLGRRPG